MKTEIEQAIAKACQDLFDTKIELVLTRPDEQFGDYATNVALQVAKKIGKNSDKVAEQLVNKLSIVLTKKR